MLSGCIYRLQAYEVLSVTLAERDDTVKERTGCVTLAHGRGFPMTSSAKCLQKASGNICSGELGRPLTIPSQSHYALNSELSEVEIRLDQQV